MKTKEQGSTENKVQRLSSYTLKYNHINVTF